MLKTTSQLLSFHQSIGEKQALYYKKISKIYPEYKETFLKLEKENLRHVEIAQRAYREGVTDAFEVGFLSTPLNPDNYWIREPENSIGESIKVMVGNEEIIIKFCLDAVSNSRLLPDLSETFESLVKRKRKNIKKLIKIE